MKKLLLFLIACTAGFSTVTAQLTGVVNEFYGTRSTGENVYRIYAELTDPTDFVSAVFGASNDPLYVGSDVGGIVNDGNGAVTGDVLNTGFCIFVPDICFDSYVTIGHAGSPTAGITVYWDDATPIACGQGVIAVSTQPTSSEFTASFNTLLGTDLNIVDGSWFSTNLPGCNDQGIPFGLNNRVLLAQVAVPVGGVLEYCLNIQIFDEAVGTASLEYVWNPAAVDAGQLDGSCLGLCQPTNCVPAGVDGCMDPLACNYDSTATQDPLNSCLFLDACGVCGGAGTVAGCTDALACNFNVLADCDDGSCLTLDACGVCGGTGTVAGCTDALACNYNALADCDDGSCEYLTCAGCTDALACNFDATATIDDGSCCFSNCVTLTVGGGAWDSEISWDLLDGLGNLVTSGFAPESQVLCLADDCYTIVMYDAFGDGWNGATWSMDTSDLLTNYGSGTLASGLTGTAGFGIPVPCGCTDPTACNFDSLAVIDDGSCILPSANDLCANAIDLGGATTTVNVDNTNACVSEGAAGSCHFGGDGEQSSVWYSVTIVAESSIVIETVDDGTGSFGDTQLTVFDGCGGAELACDDDNGLGLLSFIDMGCVPAGTYWIQVDGFSGASGTVDLNVTVAAICPQGCTDPLACNYDPLAVFDNGTCSTDNDAASCASPIVPGGLGAPTVVADDMTGATPSPESVVGTADGSDRWYSFVAQSPGVAITMSTTDPNLDGLIELHSTPGTLVDAEDVTFNGTDEILNFGGLIEGNTYYVAARTYFAIGVGGGAYSISIETLPDTRCDSGPGPYGVCATFKADWVGSDDYIFTFTSNTTAVAYVHQSGFANTFVQLGSVMGLEYGDNYTVAINSVYNRANGSGFPEVIIVDNNEPCTITIAPHPAAKVKPAYNCVNSGALFLGQYVPCQPWVCGNTDWEWEFTRTDIAELPINHFRGSTNRYLRLSDVAGLVPGGTYDVRVRPVFASAASTFGAIECIQIVGVAVAPVDGPTVSEDLTQKDVEVEGASVAIYPNPVTADVFTLNLNNVQSDIITLDILDMTGKVVQSEQITVADGNVNQIVELNDIAMGIYMVNITVDGKVQTERLVVAK